MTKALTKPYTRISSDDLREYLNRYENERHAGKVTIDNIRRIMSSFFAWLELPEKYDTFNLTASQADLLRMPQTSFPFLQNAFSHFSAERSLHLQYHLH